MSSERTDHPPLEIDIEYVSKGNSIVNNTINYTSHPSADSNGVPIFNATRSVRLPHDDFLAVYREHRFDSSPQGVQYYLDGQFQHANSHSIPQAGGSLQLNLWSDGNRYWSGSASTTDVLMKVKKFTVYFNTTATDAGTDKKWLETCTAAGGPETSICVSLAPKPKALSAQFNLHVRHLFIEYGVLTAGLGRTRPPRRKRPECRGNPTWHQYTQTHINELCDAHTNEQP